MNTQVIEAEFLKPIASGRPWVRYWARWLDMGLFSFVFGIVLQFVAPEFIDKTPDTVFTLLFVALWMLIEPIILALFGNTLIRALLSTKITMQDGRKITYIAALKRSFLVWILGQGIGIPLVNLICLIKSYNDLKDSHTTKWDQKCGTMVTHQKISVIKIILFLFILLLLGFLTVMGYMA